MKECHLGLHITIYFFNNPIINDGIASSKEPPPTAASSTNMPGNRSNGEMKYNKPIENRNMAIPMKALIFLFILICFVS